MTTQLIIGIILVAVPLGISFLVIIKDPVLRELVLSMVLIIMCFTGIALVVDALGV